MARITNTHHSPLGLPGGPVIEPGRSAKVENWDIVCEHHIVAMWLEQGLLVEGEHIEEDPEEGNGQVYLEDPNDMTKAEIVQELKDTYNVDASLDSKKDELVAALLEARSAAAE